jgi:hypothetical protein
LSVPQYNRTEKRANFQDLTGGFDSRHSPLVVEAESKSKLKAVTAQNVDFFKQGAIQKRLGKTKQGDDVTGGSSTWASQAVADDTQSSGYSSGGAQKIAQKITAGSSATISQITFKCGIYNVGLGGYSVNSSAEIWSDSAGTPGAVITNGQSSIISQSVSNTLLNLADLTDTTFTFPTPPSVTNGTVYWIVVSAAASSTTQTLRAAAASGATPNVKSSPTNGVTWGAGVNKDLFYTVYKVNTASVITGIYDYRHGYNQTREQLATANGNLYKRDKSGSSFISTWTSLASTLRVGQDYLTSFATLKDYAFATSSGDAPCVVWDGAATGAMRHGYRLSPPYVGNYSTVNISSISGTTITLAANQAASGLYVGKTLWLVGSANISPQEVTIQKFVTTGTAGSATYYVTSIVVEDQEIQTDHTTARWNGATLAANTGGGGAINTTGALTCFSLLAVTALKSGGYRTSEFSIDLAIATANQRIQFSNVAMDALAAGAQFAFDIPTRATTWFMSDPFNPGNSTTTTTGVSPTITYRKISAAAAFISTGLNPNLNSVTAFDVLDEVPTTNSTLLDEFGFPTQYFTAQIDAPKHKYLTVFQGFLVGAGDPSHPNRFWTSQVDAPQVWSGAGGSYGSYFDLDTNDGDVITGMAAWNTSLYIFKRHSVYYAEYTGLADQPFSIRKLQGSLGALSGWAVKGLDWGVVFLSERGPAFVSGTSLALLPGADAIQNLFDPNDSARFNLSVMQYSTCGHNATKQQVWWGVATTNATNRDQILVYDYSNRSFSLNTDSSNVLTEVGDANGFQSVWSGDYNGAIFQQESGSTDNGVNIPFVWESAWLTFTGGSDKKHLDRIWVRGDVQTSATTLTVDVYKDFSTTSSRTVTFDMTDSRFKAGFQMPLNLEAKAFKVRLSNTSAVALKVDSFEMDYQLRGMRV